MTLRVVMNACKDTFIVIKLKVARLALKTFKGALNAQKMEKPALLVKKTMRMMELNVFRLSAMLISTRPLKRHVEIVKIYSLTVGLVQMTTINLPAYNA
jgi:hypothetical protein